MISFAQTVQCAAVGIVALLFMVFVINFYVIYSSQEYIVSDIADLAPAQTVIILGAGITKEGELSLIFKDRVDTAAAVYFAKKVEKILVSGDNSSLSYNEVVPVQEYLRTLGVPAEDIFLDYAGFDTYDTMYRARGVFAVDSAVIVTQSFHLYRAVFLAEVLGLSVQGLPASTDATSPRNFWREAAARVKAIFDVLIHSAPTYLGEPIPITGDGRATFVE